MSSNTNNRLYGLDILRILSIILITFIHLIAYTGIEESQGLSTVNNIYLLSISTFTVIAVNSFIMITGYFQCEKSLNYKRIISIWFNVVMLSIVLLLAMFIIDTDNVSKMSIIKSIFPITTMHYWFLVSYIVLCISVPMLNSLIRSINKKTHLLICLLGFLIISVYYVSNPFVNTLIYVANPRGIVWFYYLYIVAAYIKKYDVSIRSFWLVLTSVLSFLFLFVFDFLNRETIFQSQLNEQYSIFPFVFSICVFLLFRKINVRSKALCRIISQLSACSFYVYIIQEHDAVRMWFWNIINIYEYQSNWTFIPITIAYVLLLWPIAWIFNLLLSRLTPVVDWLHGKFQKTIQYIENSKILN